MGTFAKKIVSLVVIILLLITAILAVANPKETKDIYYTIRLWMHEGVIGSGDMLNHPNYDIDVHFKAWLECYLYPGDFITEMREWELNRHKSGYSKPKPVPKYPYVKPYYSYNRIGDSERELKRIKHCEKICL